MRPSCAVRSRTARSARSIVTAARALRGVHAVITAADIGRDGADHSVAAGTVAGVQAVRATGHRARKGPLRRRADRGRGRGQRKPSPKTRLSRSRSISNPYPPSPTVAPPAAGKVLLFEASRQQSHQHADSGERRRRRGFRARPLYAAGALPGAAIHRRADGVARLPGGMGCRQRASDAIRRRQGRVSQSPHPGQADGAAGTAPSAWWRTTSAARSACAANSIPRIS